MILVFSSGELAEAVSLFYKRPTMFRDQLLITCFELAGYIFRRELFIQRGMLTVNFWMTARKACSAGLSLLVFGGRAGFLCATGVACSLASVGVELALLLRKKPAKPSAHKSTPKQE